MIDVRTEELVDVSLGQTGSFGLEAHRFEEG